jgi:hypothetical protein
MRRRGSVRQYGLAELGNAEARPTLLLRAELFIVRLVSLARYHSLPVNTAGIVYYEPPRFITRLTHAMRESATAIELR